MRNMFAQIFNKPLKPGLENGYDEITFQVSEENGQIKVEVDYAPLLKELSLSYTECKVSYLYQNIGKVEEIQAIPTDKIKKVDENG